MESIRCDLLSILNISIEVGYGGARRLFNSMELVKSNRLYGRICLRGGKITAKNTA